MSYHKSETGSQLPTTLLPPETPKSSALSSTLCSRVLCPWVLVQSLVVTRRRELGFISRPCVLDASPRSRRSTRSLRLCEQITALWQDCKFKLTYRGCDTKDIGYCGCWYCCNPASVRAAEQAKATWVIRTGLTILTLQCQHLPGYLSLCLTTMLCFAGKYRVSSSEPSSSSSENTSKSYSLLN